MPKKGSKQPKYVQIYAKYVQILAKFLNYTVENENKGNGKNLRKFKVDTSKSTLSYKAEWV